MKSLVWFALFLASGLPAQVVFQNGSGASGGCCVAGDNMQVQYNKSYAMGADPLFLWDYTNKALDIGGAIPAGTPVFTMGPHAPITTSWTLDTFSPSTALNNLLAGATGCSPSTSYVQYNGTCASGGSTFTGYPGVTADGSNGLNVQGGVSLGGFLSLLAPGGGMVGPNLGQMIADDNATPAGGWNLSVASTSTVGFRFWKGSPGASGTPMASLDGTGLFTANGLNIVGGATVGGNVSAGGYLQASALLPGSTTQNGSYVSWGNGATVGNESTLYYNLHDTGGPGGFEWVNWNPGYPSVQLMYIDQFGNLSVGNNIASSGDIYAGGAGNNTVHGSQFTGNAATATQLTGTGATASNPCGAQLGISCSYMFGGIMLQWGTIASFDTTPSPTPTPLPTTFPNACLAAFATDNTLTGRIFTAACVDTGHIRLHNNGLASGTWFVIGK